MLLESKHRPNVEIANNQPTSDSGQFFRNCFFNNLAISRYMLMNQLLRLMAGFVSGVSC